MITMLIDRLIFIKVQVTNVHAQTVMTIVCLKQKEYCFRLNPRVSANNNVKLHHIYPIYDPHNFKWIISCHMCQI